MWSCLGFFHFIQLFPCLFNRLTLSSDRQARNQDLEMEGLAPINPNYLHFPYLQGNTSDCFLHLWPLYPIGAHLLYTGNVFIGSSRKSLRRQPGFSFCSVCALDTNTLLFILHKELHKIFLLDKITIRNFISRVFFVSYCLFPVTA